MTPAQRVEYDAAVDSDNQPEIASLLALGDAANGNLGAIAGGVAGLTPAQRVEYDAAVGSDNKPEIARLLALGAAVSPTASRAPSRAPSQA